MSERNVSYFLKFPVRINFQSWITWANQGFLYFRLVLMFSYSVTLNNDNRFMQDLASRFVSYFLRVQSIKLKPTSSCLIFILSQRPYYYSCLIVYQTRRLVLSWGRIVAGLKTSNQFVSFVQVRVRLSLLRFSGKVVGPSHFSFLKMPASPPLVSHSPPPSSRYQVIVNSVSLSSIPHQKEGWSGNQKVYFLSSWLLPCLLLWPFFYLSNA